MGQFISTPSFSSFPFTQQQKQQPHHTSSQTPEQQIQAHPILELHLLSHPAIASILDASGSRARYLAKSIADRRVRYYASYGDPGILSEERDLEQGKLAEEERGKGKGRVRRRRGREWEEEEETAVVGLYLRILGRVVLGVVLVVVLLVYFWAFTRI